MVEETGARMFGLEEDEVIRRRKYVVQVRREIDVSHNAALLYPRY